MNIEALDNNVWVFIGCLLLMLACQGGNHGKADMQDVYVPPNDLAIPQKTKIDWELWPVDLSIRYLTGHFDPAKDTIFTLIDQQYADRSGMYIRKDTYRAFQAMNSAAREEGIILQIRSATRNFDYQKSIWEKKWTGQTPIE